LAQGFGPGAIGPLVVAVDLPPTHGTAAVTQLRQRLAGLSDVQAVSPARYNPSHDAAVVDVIPRTGPQDAATATLVNTIRGSVVPDLTSTTGVQVLVGGETAASIDTSNLISRHLGLVIAFVVILSLLVLALAFRSVVVPVASALATLLSTGAAYGIVVAVFQWGWLGGAIDNHTTAPVDPWIPVMLFALLFGLSMDYQVFLISRIREARLAGRRDAEAVTEGLTNTGRVITSAALIMIFVFGAFVLGDLRVLKVFGFAMAAAILLDATLVRMVLMPASLRLLGRAAWWFPRRLGQTVSSGGPEPIPVPARSTSDAHHSN
jgi:RND superfamily putative drug exporter